GQRRRSDGHDRRPTSVLHFPWRDPRGDAVTRIQEVFATLRLRGERALIPYFTAGDPSLAMTRQLVIEAARRGADLIELGIPFSDPLADGPVIQRATQRALAAGVTLPRVLELVREIRNDVTLPMVFLTYYNPVLAFGLKAFCQTAVEAGVDGLIVADLPPEEAGALPPRADPADLGLIHFLGTASAPDPHPQVAKAAGGFLHQVSLA